MTTATAPGKIILCGEHAVVYGRPAIALPLPGLRAYAHIDSAPPGSGLLLKASDLGREWMVDETTTEPLGKLAYATLRSLGISRADMVITITSTIPIAGGMGSGAAVATALVRAISAYTGCHLHPGDVSALVYESERGYHGTPSGIDNTVIAYEQPVWFVRQAPNTDETSGAISPTAYITPLSIARPLRFVIGDSGVRSKTRMPVGEVQRRWKANPSYYEQLFDQVRSLAEEIRDALATGHTAALGTLLDTNQSLLEQMGVSSPELERLIAAARSAGAMGAKLSGAGWGGIMIALTDEINSTAVAEALRYAGATDVIETIVNAYP